MKSQATPIRYTAITKIDGHHPLKQAVNNCYVGYKAFHRISGELAYFNFELAKEMGLINRDQAHQMTVELSRKLLDTFSLQIINEYDIENHTKIDSNSIKPGEYMATRYLQIQHPSKQGKTSGDGRSIWNGYVKTRDAIWDISSCGTGATCLSPATSIENKFFKTGSRMTSYGCGQAEFSEGLIAALFSQLMYQNHLPTERILAVIRYKNGTSINVRAAKNLLRPAHFFGYMKRAEYQPLKKLLDYHLDREINNGYLNNIPNSKKKYLFFLQKFTRDFARISATFESEYIFCWMDWDGDNILMDGGIIDYGTVRQFGLFHHEYRYDDASKMSTTITEQKRIAKYTVQRFAQIVNFVMTGEKKNIKQFSKDIAMTWFDEYFEETMNRKMLEKIGFTSKQQNKILKNTKLLAIVIGFRKHYRYFEKSVSGRRAYKTPDGINRDAIFCMRDFLREFPVFYLKNKILMPSDLFIYTIASNYSSNRDLVKFQKKHDRIVKFQKKYIELITQFQKMDEMKGNQLLTQLTERSAIINKYDRLTGNGIINIIGRLVRIRKSISFQELQTILHELSLLQIFDPDYQMPQYNNVKYRETENTKKIVSWAEKLTGKFRESI